MDFDLDDPLGDLLSEGSNDSFFEEAKPVAKRSSLSKTPENKIISNLFGLGEENEAEKKTEEAKQSSVSKISEKKDLFSFDDDSVKKKPEAKTTQGPKTDGDWLGLGTKTKIKDSQPEPLKATKKISFEDTDDVLNTLGLEKIDKAAKMEPGKKSALLESILGPPKQVDAKLEPQKSQKTTEQQFGYASLDAPRESRRRTATNLKDPLGLFTNTNTEDQENLSIQVSPIKKKELQKTSGWLKESVGETIKNMDMKTKSVPNLTNLPEWLSNEPMKTHKSESEMNKIEECEIKPIQEPQRIDQTPTIETFLTQQKFATSHMEYQNTSIALQQQESQILMALQLKKYDENLLEMQKKQQDILVKQEQQFNSLLERQFAKQQILENNMRLQQERINNHIQMLISQPPVTPIPHSEKSLRVDELKKSNIDESNDLHQNFIKSLKQRHQEEIFLLEESYKKQITTLEQSATAVEKQLKDEIADLNQRHQEKIENIYKEHEEELAKHKIKLEDLSERHKNEIELVRGNQDRVVEEIKYEYNSIIENIKQTKLSETELLGNATNYSEKLENNLQVLGSNSKILLEVREKIEKDYNILSLAREESIKTKENEIAKMREALDKARESAETERAQLMGLISTLEMKLSEQIQNGREERWAMQQAAATLTAKSSALDRETEFLRNSIEREREQLKCLKESHLGEQEKIILQLTEEKLSLSTERARLETASKLNQYYDSQKARTEIDAAIQVAKEAVKMTDQERDQLYRQQAELESFKRTLIDRERKLEQKERELSMLLQTTERKTRENERALAEARALEENYNERLKSIQKQLFSLTTREKKLNEQKIALSKERLALSNIVRQSKKCSLCAAEVSNKKDDEDLEPLRIEHERMINYMDPDLLRLRMEINESRERITEDNTSQ